MVSGVIYIVDYLIGLIIAIVSGVIYVVDY